MSLEELLDPVVHADPAAAKARAARAKRPSTHRTDTTPGTRHRIPDLTALVEPLAASGQVESLVKRLGGAAAGRAGAALRHVTYAAMPHGAKSYLAAAVALASGERSSGSRATRRSRTASRTS